MSCYIMLSSFYSKHAQSPPEKCELNPGGDRFAHDVGGLLALFPGSMEHAIALFGRLKRSNRHKT